MKKSQILAAIALAMALGVVAPVAVAENSVYAAEQSAAQKAAEAAVKEFKQSFSTIKTVNTNGVLAQEYTGAAAYGYIDDNANALTTALDFVKTAEKKDGAVTTAFKNAIKLITNGAETDGSAKDDLKPELEAINSVKDLFGTDWTNADLATAKKTVKQAITNINAAATAETDQDTKTTLQNIARDLQGATTDAEIQKLVDAAVKAADQPNTGDSAFKALNGLYTALTGKTAGAINTEAQLNTIASAVKAGFGVANWDKYSRGHLLVDEIEGKIDTATDELLTAWTNQLKGAANGSGDTTVDPVKPDINKPGVNAPATGIAGTAEGTATTVSIVAGLATALTALGAGVVAYRSARRK